MAITEDKGDDGQTLNLPRSTGAVEYEPPKDPDPIEGDPGKSTGAVKYESPTMGNITNPDAENGGQAEVRVETPKEPVTMTSSWLSESQAKVVEKQHQESARRSVQEPKKSRKAETPEDERKVETKAAADDDLVDEDHPGGDDLPAGESLPPDQVSKKDSGRRVAKDK